MPTLYNPGKKKGIFFIPSGATKSPTPPTPSFSNTKSILFDGVDDYIAAGSYTALDTTQTFSISMWIKLPSGGGGYVVGKNNTASYWGRRFSYYITESTIEINTSNLAFRNQSLSLAIDTWMNIAMVFDRGEAVQLDRCKIYQNGVPVTNVANSNFAQVAADASPLILGARQAGTTSPIINTPFEGNIDEISIWSNALTSDDVSDIWNNGVPTDLTGETGLINWWRMGDEIVSFPTIPDQVGSNNGTAYNENEATMVVENVP